MVESMARLDPVNAEATRRPTLIIGLGNPILGDDGVGWRVAEQVALDLDGKRGFEIDCLALGGLSLMERLIGYDRVILVDAVTTGRGPAGSVTKFSLDEIPDAAFGHSGSAHDTSLKTALRMAELLGSQIPREIMIVGVEAAPVFDFSESLSPAVTAAVPEAAIAVLELVKQRHWR